MSLAGRFAAALADESGDDDGHLLPDRLSRVAARLLRVDGAGLTVLNGPYGRSPLGGSSPEAARAERLQFTIGAGPCLLAQESSRPVFVVEEDLRLRWPAFAELLVARTPFRGIVALPLRPPVSAALDLFVRDPGDVARIDVFDAVSVGDLITATLTDAAVWSTWSEAAGPEWLRSPAGVRRAAVWHAVGRTGAALDVDAPAALALLRAHAYALGRSVDALAAEVLSGRLMPEELADRPGER